MSGRLEVLEAENARLRAERDEVTAYMRNLLITFVGEHFPDNDGWKPLDDLVGMLTQIDNASTIAREYKARLAEAMKVLEEAREVVDACAGDNRPARAWAVTVRDGIDAVFATRRVHEGRQMIERWSIDGVTYCPIKKSEGAFVRHSDYAELEAQLAEVDAHRRKILAENERLLNAFIEKNRTLSALEATKTAQKVIVTDDMVEAASHEYMRIFGKYLLSKHARLILTAALEA